MAFLCPYGINKRKEKEIRTPPHDAYIRNEEYDDLDMPLPLEVAPPPTTMEVVEDYFPCSALELHVSKGEIVHYMQSEGVWIYVRALNGADGYIPRRHCRLVDPAEIIIEEDRSSSGYHSPRTFSTGRRKNGMSTSTTQLYYQDHSSSPTSSFHREEIIQKRFHSTSNINSYGQKVSRGNSLQSLSSNSSRSSSSQQQQLLAPTKNQQNGLYSNGNTNSNHFKYESKQRTRTFDNSQDKNKPVCGRKCGENCEHKKIQQNQTSGNHGLKKTSVTSVASGKAGPINKNRKDSSLDKNNNRSESSTSFELPKTQCGHPELIIIQEYRQKSDTDISVDRGDYAAIINDTKYDDWMYIVNESGERGFIPKRCAIKHECHDCQRNGSKDGEDGVENSRKTNKTMRKTKVDNQEGVPSEETVYTDQDFANMRKLVITQNYSGRNLDDLYVCVGDTVYMSPDEQSGDNWLWVHSLKLNSSGYIPKNIIKDLENVNEVEV